MSLILSNPPAIIFVNNDLSEQVKRTLIRQLRIDYVFDGYEFDQIVENNVQWIYDIKNVFDSRVMVIRNLTELQNREYADIVAFVSHGLITTEKNNFGPPVCGFSVSKIHWGQFGIFVRQYSNGCCGGCDPCKTCSCDSCGCGCKCNCKCLVPVSPRGI